MNKYFVPEMEDFRIGYQFDLALPIGVWKSGKFPELLKENSELDEFKEDDFMKLAHALYRVPYLTKEQILSEDWILDEHMNKPQSSLQWYRKNEWFLMYYPLEHILGINHDQKDFQFEGICKDINTLRIIEKLLDI